MIKLFGIPLSHNVNKVRYCLDYLKLPYEIVRTNPLQGETQTPQFKELCPTGKVPAMEIDDLKLFESNAIIRYLAKREKSSLYPQDAKQAAAVDAWLDYVAIHVDNALGRVIFNRILAPMLNKEADERSLKFGLEMMDAYLPIIEKQLSIHANIAGNDFSIADINLLAILDPCEMVNIDLNVYKSISRWRNALKGKDFYQKAAKERQEFMQAMMAAKK